MGIPEKFKLSKRSEAWALLHIHEFCVGLIERLDAEFK